MATVDALQLFVEVMDRESFTGAARARGLDPSVVSRRMRKLEADLGVPLFRRTTRALNPTDAARSFYERVMPALKDIQEAQLELAAPEGTLRGPLRIAAPGALGRIRIAPVVHTFVRSHPEVTPELRLSDRRLDLVREGIDVAVRVGTPSDRGQVVRRLGVSEQWVVASPGYLAAHPDFDDLASHQLILRIESGRLIDIRATLPPEVRERIGVSLITDDLAATADAARADLGVAGLPRWLVEPDVQQGTLVRLPLGPSNFNVPIYAVLVAGHRATARTRAFVDALASALSG